MTQQTNGTPELKYSEETFRDMYEALKEIREAFSNVIVSLPRQGGKTWLLDSLRKGSEALTKAEGK